jgi:hypothetical protein
MVQRGRIYFDYVPCCILYTQKGNKEYNTSFLNKRHMKTKSDFIKVRVTENEKKMLQYHAIQLNITISELVRKFIIIKN